MHLRSISTSAALALALAAPVLAQQPAQPAPAAKTPAAAQAPAAMPAHQPFDAKVARRITAEEVKKRMDAGEKVTIIDTRSAFTGPMVKGATQVPVAKVPEWSKDLAKDTLIVAYCT